MKLFGWFEGLEGGVNMVGLKGWREGEEGRDIFLIKSQYSVENFSSFCSQQTHTHML